MYRIEQMFERWGFPLDRGTMSRWLEQLGAIFGATIIEATKKEAFQNAFCMQAHGSERGHVSILNQAIARSNGPRER